MNSAHQARMSTATAEGPTERRRGVSGPHRCGQFPTPACSAWSRVGNPEGAGNPLGAWAYSTRRTADQRPWSVAGSDGPLLPATSQRGGSCRSGLPDATHANRVLELLEDHGVALAAGPIQRFGTQGWGTSVYCHDPSGSGIELIYYAAVGDGRRLRAPEFESGSTIVSNADSNGPGRAGSAVNHPDRRPAQRDSPGRW
jgi:hypothetical protein